MNLTSNEEIWRDLPGYEGYYQVSSFGSIRSVTHKDRYGRLYEGRVLKPIPSIGGYLRVRLSKNEQKDYPLIHRIVASVFVPNPSDFKYVNHIDENPSNNRADNLEWCTHEYNINFGTRNSRAGAKHRGERCCFSKLSKEDVLTIRTVANGKHDKKLCHDIAELYGVSAANIRHILVGDSWTWV